MILANANLKEGWSPNRRRVLRLSPLFLFAGCSNLTEESESFLLKVQRFNDWVQEKVFDPEVLSAELFEPTPEESFRVNSYDSDEPPIDVEHWKLDVGGLVAKPRAYSLEEISSLPKKVMITKHCCVEGWSMNPKWGGTPLRTFLDYVGADPKAKYVYTECGDEYYTTYDISSARHPQTLLCYEAYNKPLSLQHGAPMRIVMPVKLGYKSAKWIRTLIVTNERRGGYLGGSRLRLVCGPVTGWDELYEIKPSNLLYAMGFHRMFCGVN